MKNAQKNPVIKSFNPATVVEIAALMGVSTKTVYEQVQKGNIIQSERGLFDIQASLPKYCQYLRDLAKGRGGEEGIATSASFERGRLAKAQATKVELLNATTRGELVPAADVQRKWSDILRNVRGRILAAPSRIGARAPHLSREDIQIVDSELREALTELAKSRPSPDAPDGA